MPPLEEGVRRRALQWSTLLQRCIRTEEEGEPDRVNRFDRFEKDEGARGRGGEEDEGEEGGGGRTDKSMVAA